jgi:hypothetical protein
MVYFRRPCMLKIINCAEREPAEHQHIVSVNTRKNVELKGENTLNSSGRAQLKQTPSDKSLDRMFFFRQVASVTLSSIRWNFIKYSD